MNNAGAHCKKFLFRSSFPKKEKFKRNDRLTNTELLKRKMMELRVRLLRWEARLLDMIA
jgi:hypothetical protein